MRKRLKHTQTQIKPKEYDNETTKTAGIPGCKTGKILFGYGDKQPVGGFGLDEFNNYIATV